LSEITIYGEHFSLFIPASQIQSEIRKMAEKINTDLSGKDVVFVVILNGAFMFAADLLRQLNFQPEVTFIRVGSYDSMSSSGKVSTIIGLKENIENRIVVVLEDIIDSGLTMENIMNLLRKGEPASLRIAALLLKEESYKKDVIPDYTGFRIPNRFVAGYGLDYKGFGRNLADLYIYKE